MRCPTSPAILNLHMLDHEYRQKLSKNEKRDWTLTSFTGGLALILWGIIVAAWKYIGHDPVVIIGIMIPAGFLAVILTLAAMNGRKSAIKAAWVAILDSIILLPPY